MNDIFHKRFSQLIPEAKAAIEKKEFVLPFSIIIVTKAFLDSMELSENSLTMSNEINNTYTFTHTEDFNAAVIDALFIFVTEDSTNCVFEIIHKVGRYSKVSSRNEMFESYITQFTNLAFGKVNNVRKIVSHQHNKPMLETNTILWVLGGALAAFIILAKLTHHW